MFGRMVVLPSSAHARWLEPSGTPLWEPRISHLLAFDVQGRRIPVRVEALRTHHHALPVRFKNANSVWWYEYTPKRENVYERGIMLSSPSDVSLLATTSCWMQLRYSGSSANKLATSATWQVIMWPNVTVGRTVTLLLFIQRTKVSHVGPETRSVYRFLYLPLVSTVSAVIKPQIMPQRTCCFTLQSRQWR
jgi:hypothetical protein